MASGIVAVSALEARAIAAVEARNLLEPVDDAQHELRPKPERQGTHDALALRAPSLGRLAVGHESRT